MKSEQISQPTSESDSWAATLDADSTCSSAKQSSIRWAKARVGKLMICCCAEPNPMGFGYGCCSSTATSARNSDSDHSCKESEVIE